jgi:signal transduction histidine kinase
VALATALAGTLAAALAALITWQIATTLIDQAEIDRLSASAEIFLNDIDSESETQSLDAVIAEELAELAPASIRIAVYIGGRHAGGDPLPIPAGKCAATRQGKVIQRSCSSSRRGLTVVAATTRASGASSGFILGSVLASLAAAVLAAVIGQRAARWAIAPLQKLTESLERVRADEPSPDDLPPPGKVREVVVLHEALSALVLRLGEALMRARSFSADAAHELRTPLTVLSGQLELLLEETADGERRSELLALQLRVRTLTRLVERLLLLATSEQGPLPSSDPVALEDVARHCVEALPLKDSERVKLAIDDQAVTSGDEYLLGALLDNALDNALKFSASGPVTLRVSEADDQVVLDVIDEGPGLDDTARRRAFDAFFRAPSARAGGFPGHGIGLALVAQVTRQHGGTCEFLPTSRGAHLRVLLPAWRPKS